jgi:hypothetical protein
MAWMSGLFGSLPVRAAEELVLQLDGLALPLDLVALEAWTRQPDQAGNDLGVWLNLLEPQSRRDLIRLLRAPLLRDRSFGLQLLNSWTGEQMLKEAGSLLTAGPDGHSTAPLLLSSLRQLLEQEQRFYLGAAAGPARSQCHPAPRWGVTAGWSMAQPVAATKHCH